MSIIIRIPWLQYSKPASTSPRALYSRVSSQAHSQIFISTLHIEIEKWEWAWGQSFIVTTFTRSKVKYKNCLVTRLKLFYLCNYKLFFICKNVLQVVVFCHCWNMLWPLPSVPVCADHPQWLPCYWLPDSLGHCGWSQPVANQRRVLLVV